MSARRVEMVDPRGVPVPAGTRGWLEVADGGYLVRWDNGVEQTFPGGDGSHIAIVQEDAPPVCDFCSRPAARWEFGARDEPSMTAVGPKGAVTHVSEGGWLACDECRVDVEARRWAVLRERSAIALAARLAAPVGVVMEAVELPHGTFRRAWDGKPAQRVRLPA